MPKAFPKEFRDDVAAIAMRREASFAQIAKDFGISESCVQRWVKIAEIDGGRRPGVSTSEAVENRELRRRVKLLEQENEILRRAAAYLSQANLSGPKRLYPLVSELAADGIAVAVTCRVLKFAKQPYYRWLANPVSKRDEAQLINAAIDIHVDDPAFGYRFIADELAEAGFTASERRVWRLCSQMGITSAFVQKKRGKNRRAASRSATSAAC